MITIEESFVVIEKLLVSGFETKIGIFPSATVQINVVQLAAISDESKLMTPLMMENIADSVLTESLASPAEVERNCSRIV
jgi:hypothetical protein